MPARFSRGARCRASGCCGSPPCITSSRAFASLRACSVGRASVEGTANPLGWLAARLLRFPRATDDIPVEVTMTADPDGEIWVRQFGGGRFQSRLSHGGLRTGSIEERFGLVTFRLALTANADGIDMNIVAGRIGGVPLPGWMLPRCFARERVDAQGRFTFDVPMSLPVLGRLVHYRGWLVPARNPPSGL
jgi:hypothetical protein